MRLFGRKKEEEMLEITGELLKAAAKVSLRAMIDDAKKIDSEESLTLVKKAGSEDAKHLEINIEYTGSTTSALIYTYLIVKRMATIMGEPFEKVIGLLKVTEQIWPEVTKGSVEKEEINDE
mgnify:CR=1 FL=1